MRKGAGILRSRCPTMIWRPVRHIARPRWRTSHKLGRLGVTGVAAIAALGVILIAGWILDQRGASAADQRLAALAKSAEADPLDLVTRAARANRIVFLADIHNSVATKEFAARAITAVAKSSGLDAVVLEVGRDQQPYIDLYFDRAPEDASVLLAHPRTIREPGAATRGYLEIYRAIWKLNEKLGPAERVRVIAADLPGWPQARPGSPAEAAREMGQRSRHMTDVVDQTVLSTIPTARIFVFMTGFNAMKSGSLMLQTGGTVPVSIKPFAHELAAATDEVYSILVDAPLSGSSGREVAPYLGTRVTDVLREQGVRRRFAATITDEFDYLKQPLLEKKTPGMEFNIDPRDYRLRDVADAYINLGS